MNTTQQSLIGISGAILCLSTLFMSSIPLVGLGVLGIGVMLVIVFFLDLTK